MAIEVDAEAVKIFEATIKVQNNVTFEESFINKLNADSFFVLSGKIIYFMSMNGRVTKKQLINNWPFSFSVLDRQLQFFKNHNMLVSSYYTDSNTGKLVVFNPTHLWHERKDFLLNELNKQMEARK